ncbi:hypothetical protein DL89DRAFT_64816 [Linderina pennispora]|uniref:Uncharacterized protein n=1 Tax=Linderina pennispora TaxID=61395 RepID=A0A1Y1W0C7_9FUNG|nr:uncharacterized protein DL89DRAFT_64816 [Linderina pennispora]ORX66564.1 hypothetical protein DL89DRAFT_64816 [Linderina pennispora]
MPHACRLVSTARWPCVGTTGCASAHVRRVPMAAVCRGWAAVQATPVATVYHGRACRRYQRRCVGAAARLEPAADRPAAAGPASSFAPGSSCFFPLFLLLLLLLDMQGCIQHRLLVMLQHALCIGCGAAPRAGLAVGSHSLDKPHDSCVVAVVAGHRLHHRLSLPDRSHWRTTLGARAGPYLPCSRIAQLPGCPSARRCYGTAQTSRTMSRG